VSEDERLRWLDARISRAETLADWDEAMDAYLAAVASRANKKDETS
jgi:hypothetical protein